MVPRRSHNGCTSILPNSVHEYLDVPPFGLARGDSLDHRGPVTCTCRMQKVGRNDRDLFLGRDVGEKAGGWRGRKLRECVYVLFMYILQQTDGGHHRAITELRTKLEGASSSSSSSLPLPTPFAMAPRPTTRELALLGAFAIIFFLLTSSPHTSKAVLDRWGSLLTSTGNRTGRTGTNWPWADDPASIDPPQPRFLEATRRMWGDHLPPETQILAHTPGSH